MNWIGMNWLDWDWLDWDWLDWDWLDWRCKQVCDLVALREAQLSSEELRVDRWS
jgi:hypothetical protein